MVAGPRSYTVGTTEALVLFSQGYCYFPDCTEPIIRFVEGQPMLNFQRAHIHAATEGGPYYDESMTDAQRAHFDNLIPLCTPHHNLVDKRSPGDYPPEIRRQWKHDHENDGLDALKGLSGLTEERLAAMIEEALATSTPRRQVEVTLSAGLFDGVSQLMELAWESVESVAGQQPAFAELDRVVVLTVRNVGYVPLTVESRQIGFRLGDALAGSLLASDHYPFVNPVGPRRLETGESVRYFYRLDAIGAALMGLIKDGRKCTDIRGEISLASGESEVSDLVGIERLPIWKADGGPKLFEMVRSLRNAHSAGPDS